jgi:hypothetical protein
MSSIFSSRNALVMGLPIFARRLSEPVSGASVIERSPDPWSARSTGSVTAGMRIDDTEVRKPMRRDSSRMRSISGWSPTAVARKPSWSVTRRARSSEPRMKSAGCQRKVPMPKVAQQ